jgi:hypothetical protein
MASEASEHVQSEIADYGIFWQLWPLVDLRSGEHRPVGVEVELIGAHTLDVNHLDPACSKCHNVKISTARNCESHYSQCDQTQSFNLRCRFSSEFNFMFACIRKSPGSFSRSRCLVE